MTYLRLPPDTWLEVYLTCTMYIYKFSDHIMYSFCCCHEDIVIKQSREKLEIITNTVARKRFDFIARSQATYTQTGVEAGMEQATS